MYLSGFFLSGRISPRAPKEIQIQVRLLNIFRLARFDIL